MELIGYYDQVQNYRADVVTLLLATLNKLDGLAGKTTMPGECTCSQKLKNIENLLSALSTTTTIQQPATTENYFDGSNSFIKSECYACSLGPDECRNSAIEWIFTLSGWVACPYGTDIWSRNIFG